MLQEIYEVSQEIFDAELELMDSADGEDGNSNGAGTMIDVVANGDAVLFTTPVFGVTDDSSNFIICYLKGGVT